MDSSTVDATPSALVVFGPNQIDTSRAEMLVQCLNNKIKEKRYKLQKIVVTNEEKKKRNEMLKNEKIQLTAQLNHIEQENSVREQQLQIEQNRIKELQMNIQMLDEHNNSLKRDLNNEERKYEEEKSILIEKFERTKQQWTDVFKPQYEQSRVYQYLKENDFAHKTLVERKESLLKVQKSIHRDFFNRREEFSNEKSLRSSIVTMAKSFLNRRDQTKRIEEIKEKFLQLENQQKQLIESKMDKMKAWENVYTQPVQRDLMDFCLQTNIDQALTISFNQIQQDVWSQPTTPVSTTSFNEENQFVQRGIFPAPGTTESSISFVPISNLPSVLCLTTAIEDDDEEVFSASTRKLPTAQMEKMSINDHSSSTQAFVVPSSSSEENQSNETLTQAFHVPSASAVVESNSTETFVKPISNNRSSDSTSIPSNESTTNKSNMNTSFQLAPPRAPSRSIVPVSSSIQPQVTSTDVQQMLLTFSSGPVIVQDEPPHPMEEENIEQTQPEQQQRLPEFPMISSIESTTTIDEEYSSFNYNFAFNGRNTNDNGNATAADRPFTSPINFDGWPNLSSPIGSNSNDQFSAFLQQNNNNGADGSNSFTFPSFSYSDLGTDESFGAFFFPNSINRESTSDGK